MPLVLPFSVLTQQGDSVPCLALTFKEEEWGLPSHPGFGQICRAKGPSLKQSQMGWPLSHKSLKQQRGTMDK